MNKTVGQKAYDFLIQLILIIVGVFAALAVENYRESLQEHRTEKEYLISLRNAVQADTIMLKKEIQRTYIKIEAINQLLELAKSYSRIDDEQFGEVVTDALMLIRPDNVTSVYEELKFTGNFKLIRNNDLKLEIIGYYSNISLVQQENDKTTTYPKAFMKLINLNELGFKVPFDQNRIYKGMNNAADIKEELLDLQKTIHVIRTTMIYNLMPKCINLLENLEAEIRKRS